MAGFTFRDPPPGRPAPTQGRAKFSDVPFPVAVADRINTRRAIAVGQEVEEVARLPTVQPARVAVRDRGNAHAPGDSKIVPVALNAIGPAGPGPAFDVPDGVSDSRKELAARRRKRAGGWKGTAGQKLRSR